jgi:hypothetical protein
MTWQQRTIIQRAKAAGTGLSEKETKALEKLRVTKLKTVRGCGCLAAAMFLVMLSHWI